MGDYDIKVVNDLASLGTFLIQVQDSLRKEQQQRSEDQRSHGDMLKELQTLIARERDSQSTCKTKAG